MLRLVQQVARHFAIALSRLQGGYPQPWGDRPGSFVKTEVDTIKSESIHQEVGAISRVETSTTR